jgi:hypothetical protein
MTAQDHFSGIKIQMDSACLALLWIRLNFRILILNTNFFSASINAANNKVGFNDLINNSNNIADLIFQGNEPVLELMLKYTVPDLPWKKTNGLLQ